MNDNKNLITNSTEQGGQTSNKQKKAAEKIILDKLNRIYDKNNSKDDQALQEIKNQLNNKSLEEEVENIDSQIISSARNWDQPSSISNSNDLDLDLGNESLIEHSTESTNKEALISQEKNTESEQNQPSIVNQNFNQTKSCQDNLLNQTSTESITTQAQETPYQPSKEEWEKYHTAWQDYYQKYYEYYYAQQLQKATENFSENYSADEDDSLNDIKAKIRNSVSENATKARKSHHFWPIMSAVTIALIILFLQYNQLFIAKAKAYITPAETAPELTIIDPLVNGKVKDGSRIIIPKINVKAPIVYGVDNSNASQQKALQRGTSQFPLPGANSRPGHLGNTVINGHSSDDVFDPGDYKFIFANLDKLNKNDNIYIDYQNTRYTYSVISKQVIKPTEVYKISRANDKPYLTLITCYPVGTSRERLIIFAEQILPDPTQAPAKPQIIKKVNKQNKITGESKSFFQKLFGN